MKTTYIIYTVDADGMQLAEQWSEEKLAKFQVRPEDSVADLAINMVRSHNDGLGYKEPARHLFKIEKVQADVIYTNNTGDERLSLLDLKCNPIKINLW